MAVAAKGDVLVAFIGCAWVDWDDCEGPLVLGFGEMFRGTADEGAVAEAVENCAEAVMAEGEIAPVVVLDLAWKGPGVLLARKAEKKLAKKDGLWVGMLR